jgi:hypothetical protein
MVVMAAQGAVLIKAAPEVVGAQAFLQEMQ